MWAECDRYFFSDFFFAALSERKIGVVRITGVNSGRMMTTLPAVTECSSGLNATTPHRTANNSAGKK